MLIRGIYNLTLGRLRLPLRGLGGAEPGEAVVEGQAVRVKSQTNVSMRLLTDLEVNQPGGVAGLDNSGFLAPSVIPPSESAASLAGQLILYTGDPFKIPSGYLVLDGGRYLRSVFPKLANVYGSLHGADNSDLYFRVPNLVGQSIMGASVGLSGRVGACHIISGGEGFSDGVTVFNFEGGSPSSVATGEAIVLAGKVRGIRIISGGNYSAAGSAPADGSSNCGIKVPAGPLGPGNGLKIQIVLRPAVSVPKFWIQVDAPGSGYLVGTRVNLGGTLVGASAEPVIKDGRILHVILTDPGNQDISAATATVIAAGGTGAALSIQSPADPALIIGDSIGAAYARQHGDEVGVHNHTIPQYQFPAGFAMPGKDGDGPIVDQFPTSSTPIPQYANRHTPSVCVIPLVKAE